MTYFSLKYPYVVHFLSFFYMTHEYDYSPVTVTVWRLRAYREGSIDAITGHGSRGSRVNGSSGSWLTKCDPLSALYTGRSTVVT